ncbi:MAG: LysR substrate-binding domain-containing protein, partial [Pseudomonadales bacterium]
RWNRCVIVPKDHPLAQVSKLTIQDLADQPLVTYVFGFTGRSKLDDAFVNHGLAPRVVFTATDADVIKTYVRLGLGIGIVAHMAYEPELDSDLVALEASHLFGSSVTRIGFRRGTFLRGFMYDFIEKFAPHLTQAVVTEACERHTKNDVDELFKDIELPQM